MSAWEKASARATWTWSWAFASVRRWKLYFRPTSRTQVLAADQSFWMSRYLFENFRRAIRVVNFLPSGYFNSRKLAYAVVTRNADLMVFTVLAWGSHFDRDALLVADRETFDLLVEALLVKELWVHPKPKSCFFKWMNEWRDVTVNQTEPSLQLSLFWDGNSIESLDFMLKGVVQNALVLTVVGNSAYGRWVTSQRC